MNEAETRAELIDPALQAAGWGVVEGSRIRREYTIIPGRIEGKGRHRKLLKADYILAVADLGHPEDISKAFAGFQKYLYADKVA
jgi:type I site-specific restriction endonuclease